MQIKARKIIYDYDEIELFAPLWKQIRDENPELEEKRVELARKGFLADEVALIERTDPLVEELDSFNSFLKKKALEIRPDLSPQLLQNFSVYVFYHEEGSNEFEFSKLFNHE